MKIRISQLSVMIIISIIMLLASFKSAEALSIKCTTKWLWKIPYPYVSCDIQFHVTL